VSEKMHLFATKGHNNNSMFWNYKLGNDAKSNLDFGIRSCKVKCK